MSSSIRADNWAAKITQAFNKTRAGIFDIGHLLLAAKKDLPHGEFIAMVESQLPFKARQAQRLMAIAKDLRLSKATCMSHLPVCMATLYDLTKVDDDKFDEMLRSGQIQPDMKRKDVASINYKALAAADAQRVKRLVPDRGRYRTIVLDPPWSSGGGRGTPYAVMSQDELEDPARLPVRDWLHQDEAHLYCWTTAGEMRNALHLLELWGIEFQSILTWVKPKWTLGHYFRNRAEFVLFGTRGRLRTREAARRISTVFEAPASGVHSEKPDLFYDIVRQASHPPFAEAFQRTARSDFTGLFVPRSRNRLEEGGQKAADRRAHATSGAELRVRLRVSAVTPSDHVGAFAKREVT